GRLLDVRDLSIRFRTPRGEVGAVRDLSFAIGPGETVGMVGESGSGKSVTGLAVMGLLPTHSARVSGEVRFAGRNLLDLGPAEMERVRGAEIGMIFQEPMTALDPVFNVGQQIGETLRAHQDVSRKEARRRAVELLDAVGIPLAGRRVDDYPHQLSGGMRQRVVIAIALACEPQLLIADEPTTALDVTIQAQILDLLRQLSRDRGTAVLLITHDLGVVAEACERVITLYAGEVVESSTVDDALEHPRHPYTSGLVRAIPRAGVRKSLLYAIPGRVPALHEMPAGCRFHPRCEHALERCVAERQALVEVGPGRLARCWRWDELELEGALG
ncbi:MAG: ATP-binding cassette domain-containing protein, partial [Acidimicrobiia bacterium]|nr:ATP-binding cassette domain-containing protein [Acidimicrobiia bacterium]